MTAHPPFERNPHDTPGIPKKKKTDSGCLHGSVQSADPPLSFSAKARKYSTEIIITVSTTAILAAASMQYMGVRAVRTSTELMKNPELHAFLKNTISEPLPQLIFFLILPLITLLIMKEPLRKYGFLPGDWKKGLLYTFACLALLAPLLFWASTMSDFREYYTRHYSIGFTWLLLKWGLYMFSWEFLLRGYLYFSLEERTGSLAIWLQSVPFAIAHLGKPPAEALTCFFGGLVLGYISMKTRSFLYAFLIHWGIYMMLAAFILIGTK